ncbi:prephenate dehydratase [Cystobasidiomycetes sp. EMM_F5]
MNGHDAFNGNDAATPVVSTLGPASKEFFGDLASYKLQETISGAVERDPSASSRNLNALFSPSYKYVITDVFKAVDSGLVDYGVVPIENSTNGPVNETQHCLTQFSIRELGRRRLRIGHAMLRSRGSADRPVEVVYSHEQALGQCRHYIRKHYPSATIHEVNSTALASKLASETPVAVAISSLLCAEEYGLDIVDTDIQDGEMNETTFIKFENATSTSS